jgi:pyridoxal phosphate enzyme (YggS family)
MAVNREAFQQISNYCSSHKVQLIAVSKTKPAEDILALYQLGHRDFGENYVQELVAKQAELPGDIRWHFIGHLQSNKVKYIAPFVHLIHGVDSLKLLKEINKQAAKCNRVIDCLLQLHIATEETKFGLDEQELHDLLTSPELPGLKNICIKGLMGMASFSDDMNLVRSEFQYLKSLFDKWANLSPDSPDSYRDRDVICDLSSLSMGMSADYEVAIDEGSTMVRIGSLLFGARG